MRTPTPDRRNKNEYKTVKRKSRPGEARSDIKDREEKARAGKLSKGGSWPDGIGVKFLHYGVNPVPKPPPTKGEPLPKGRGEREEEVMALPFCFRAHCIHAAGLRESATFSASFAAFPSLRKKEKKKKQGRPEPAIKATTAEETRGGTAL